MHLRLLVMLALCCSITACDGKTPALGNETMNTEGSKVAYAEVDVKCGGHTYTLSTGSDKGKCGVNYSGGKATDASCSDGDNKASLNCSFNGACLASEGSGKCKAK